MKIQIKHRYTNEVLFEHEQENNTLKLTVEEAVRQKVNLSGAYLYGAYLFEANLSRADLYGANLSEANLSGAYLSGAYLYGANLSEANLSRAYLYGAYLPFTDLYGADLYGAYLSRADLYGANFRKAKLEEDIEVSDSSRNFLSVGPIGSRDATLLAFSTNKGLYLKTGCFSGLEEAFRERLQKTHAEGSDHRSSYNRALIFVKEELKIDQ